MSDTAPTARVIDGKAYAAALRARIARAVEILKLRHDLQPGLAVVIVGEDPASQIYVRNKVRACEETGVRSFLYEYPVTVGESELLERVASLNSDPAVARTLSLILLVLSVGVLVLLRERWAVAR